jgi:predicted AlkP superfamily phosphohydrolase/phosphomutase
MYDYSFSMFSITFNNISVLSCMLVSFSWWRKPEYQGKIPNCHCYWQTISHKIRLSTIKLAPSQYYTDRRGPDRIVVGFITTYATSAYQHWCCEFESRSRTARCIRYNIMWNSLSVTCGRSVVFVGCTGFPPSWYNWNIVESNVKSKRNPTYLINPSTRRSRPLRTFLIT